jgi:hypothetical protein
MTESRIGLIRKCLGGAHRSTNPILHQEGSTEARNVHADSYFGDFHLRAQIQDRDIRRCAPPNNESWREKGALSM